MAHLEGADFEHPKATSDGCLKFALCPRWHAVSVAIKTSRIIKTCGKYLSNKLLLKTKQNTDWWTIFV